MALQSLDIIRRSATTTPSPSERRTMEVAKLIDVSTCIGCKACQAACLEWNDVRDGVGHNAGVYDNPPDLTAASWTVMRFSEVKEGGRLEWLIRKDGCMHCQDPGCLKACPAPGAIIQYSNGIVDFHEENCIGCGYCITGCPFDIPRLSKADSRVYKCTLCSDRVAIGLEPACIKACPTGALQFGSKEQMREFAAERITDLKERGFAKAGLYDPPGVGGTHVMYVLHHADRPGLYNGLAANPGISPSVSLWKGFLKPVASLALGAAALGTFFHYMAAGPLTVREEAVSDTQELARHTARERLNHWLVALCFVLAVFSGFALFHPAFFPLSQLFGGGPWSRILHPFLGAVLILSFASMFSHFRALNRMTPADWEWVKRLPSMMGGDDSDMPAQGKYNGGQKILFQATSVCLLVMVITGIVMWRVYFTFPVTLIRISAVLHAAGAVVMAGLIMAHVYAAVWTKGTFRAMIRGTVTRAWAKQHHKTWYEEMTKD